MVGSRNINPRSKRKCDGNKSYVQIEIFGEVCYALADSGSPVTLVNYKLVPQKSRHLIKQTSSNLTGANGSKLKVIGSLDAIITFTPETKQFKNEILVVEDLTETMLIGSDFFTQNGCIINFAKLTFKAKNVEVPLLKISKNNSYQSCNVTLTETIQIPAEATANYIKCNLKSKNNRINKRYFFTTSGMFEPAENLLKKKFNIESPSYLINFYKGKGHIQISNPNTHPITIYKNQVLGKMIECNQRTVNFLNTGPETDTHSNTTAGENSGEINTESEKARKLQKLLQKLKLSQLDHLTEEQIKKAEALIEKYQHIFYDEETGELPPARLPEHEILLDTDKPIRAPFRPIPMALKPQAEKLVQDLMNKKIIEPAHKSCYHSPAFVIRRPTPTGVKYRLVVDYRKINAHVIRNSQPLPTIDTITTIWNECAYFSAIDISNAYFQVPLKEGRSREATAASIPGVGYWMFNRIPLGISSAVGFFQGLIERILLGVKNTLRCVCYMDDVATGAITFEQMLDNLDKIFDRLSQVGLLLKPEKSKLFQKELIYLGYKLDKNGLSIDPHKHDTITKMLPPKNKKSTKAFIGFSSFYRKFIKSYAKTIKSLTDLTRKDAKFVWGPEQQQAFEEIKQKLIESPILRFPDLDKKFYLTTDASSISVGAVLAQKSEEGFLHPIAYASNVLSETQQKWSSFQREFYAV